MRRTIQNPDDDASALRGLARRFMECWDSIETLVGTGRYGMAGACRLFGLARSAACRKREVAAVKLAEEGMIAEISRDHPCLDYRKVTALLRSTHGQTINPKRVARLRRGDGLQASRRGAKRRQIKPQERVRRIATRRDEVWSYDFILDSLADGPFPFWRTTPPVSQLIGIVFKNASGRKSRPNCSGPTMRSIGTTIGC